MNHNILSSPQNLQRHPQKAADYVLGNRDWMDNPRHAPPSILSGSREQFLRATSIVPSGLTYFSTAISDPGEINIARIRYAADCYSAHYLSGLPPESIGSLSVLHQKAHGWDVHHLMGLSIRGTSKKARYLRTTADYLRFAWLTSAINRLFGWPDPLDPQHYNPIHIRETWRAQPAILSTAMTEISTGFHSARIQSRKDIIAILHHHKLRVTASDRQIEIDLDGESWTLTGYAATRHADMETSLSAHRKRTTKPFLDFKDNPDEINRRLRALYDKRVAENANYYALSPHKVDDGLVVPSKKFHIEYYERSSIWHLATEPPRELDRAYPLPSPQIAPMLIPRNRVSTENGRAGDTIVRIAGKGTDGAKGTSDGCHGSTPTTHDPNSPYRISSDDVRERARTHDQRAERRAKELGEARRSIEEWLDIIRGLLRIPRWLRRYRADRKRQIQEFTQKFGPIIRPLPRSLIRKILKDQAARTILSELQQPPKQNEPSTNQPNLDI